jgi:outer membrane protein TolC
LSSLSGENLSTTQFLEIPDSNQPGQPLNVISRPELNYFESMKTLTQNTSLLINSKRMPTLAAYGRVGYGNPGLNMLQNKWDTYYFVGVKLSWNIFDWNSNRYEKNNLKIQSDIVDNNIEIFKLNTNIQIEKELKNLEKYQKLSDNNQKIIDLRQRIATRSASQFENGIITASEYLIILNDLEKARLQSEINNIQKAWTIRNVNRIAGEK